jgi:hypothetical protein
VNHLNLGTVISTMSSKFAAEEDDSSGSANMSRANIERLQRSRSKLDILRFFSGPKHPESPSESNLPDPNVAEAPFDMEATPSDAPQQQSKQQLKEIAEAELRDAMQANLDESMNLSHTEIQKFHSTFKTFDDDGSGTLDERELSKVLQLVGLPVSKQVVQRMISEADEDESGEISPGR